MKKTNARTAVASKQTQNKGPAKSDIIKSVKPITSGMDGMAVDAPGQKTLLIPNAKMTGSLMTACVVGGSYSKAAKLWAEQSSAKLANGVDSRSAPHSAKAVADNKAAGSNKADKKVAATKAKTDAKAERKAKRAEKAAPKADDNRKVTIVDKKFTYGREGSSRRSAWDALKSGMTVAAYIAAGGKAKYLPRWVAANAIKLG